MVGSRSSATIDSYFFNKTKKALVDTTDGTVIYQGYAEYGTLPSEAKWKIKRTTINGSDIFVEWSKGDSFSNVWDDRATLTYL